MTFKDLNKNYVVYILDKQDVSVTQGKVTSAEFPRMDMNVNQLPMTNQGAKMVRDITIESNGKLATYTIPENLSVTYAGNLVISTTKEAIQQEVEALKNSAEQILSSMDRQKEIVEKTTKLLAELNPMFKDKQRTEERLGGMEDKINKLSDTIQMLFDEMKNKNNNTPPKSNT